MSLKPVLRIISALFLTLLLASVALAASTRTVGISVVLNTAANQHILDELEAFGSVLNIYSEINSVTLKCKANALPDIMALDFVANASYDVARSTGPVDTVACEDFADGLNTWNLDAINVTDIGWNNRQVAYDGTGVYIAVLDTGLIHNWRQYFPEERIAEEYAIAFGGGGGDRGVVSTQPNKWEHDTDSHGTHVTSVILGFDFLGFPINGVAPMATIIPVKVLNRNSSGWSSVLAAGILYVANLKEGPLADHPVVINISLGGPDLGAIEKAAIDYAISKGVVIVASAGNRGQNGMSYPGAYEPVIAVAATGWYGEWQTACWWYCRNLPEPTNTAHFYIPDFSSRAWPWQDLDVVAPGCWVVGPYQSDMGRINYYFMSGTSMASPHVAGLAALMVQKAPGLQAAEVEAILESTAMPLSSYWAPHAVGNGLVDAQAALAGTP